MFDSNNEGLIMNPNTRDLIGSDSEQVRSHAYTLAWDIATELEITL
jgi:hypothetical protein